jgi:hypothetical protein
MPAAVNAFTSKWALIPLPLLQFSNRGRPAMTETRKKCPCYLNLRQLFNWSKNGAGSVMHSVILDAGIAPMKPTDSGG